MPNPALIALEKKLAEAKEPSRELDEQIAHAVDGVRVWSRYTSSLDAAVALCERVLPEYLVNILDIGLPAKKRGIKPQCEIAKPSDAGSDVVEGATPALALCLAIVRALIAKENPND